MLTSTLCLALSLLAGSAAAQTSIRFGPYYSLGATTSYIVEAETTMYPGETPDPQQDRLALWPGMGTDAGALIQTIVESAVTSECGTVEDGWCVFASVYTGTQEDGPMATMTADQGVTINYKYDETTQKYTQTVTIGGQVVSTLETSSGKAIGWGTAVECQDDCSGIVGAHTYKNTTIVLAEADTNFKSTLAVYNATATELTTSDSITFTIDEIGIEQSYFSPVSNS